MSDTKDPKKQVSAVEPDRPPVGAMAIWIIALLLMIGLVIVGVIQFFYVSTANELEAKAQTDRAQLLAARERDRQRLSGIEDAMAQIAANPTLLGIVTAPGDGGLDTEGTGDAADLGQTDIGLVEQAIAPEGTGAGLATAEGTGSGLATAEEALATPEGTGEALAAPEGTGEALAAPEGTGEALVTPEGTGEALEGTGEAADIELP